MIEFTKRTIKKIIVSLVIFMTITNYIMPKFVFADKDESNGGGGVLLEPVFDLIKFVDDTILQVLQDSFIANEKVVIEGETAGDFERVMKGVKTVLIGTACIVTAGVIEYFSGGLGTSIAGALLSSGLGAIATAFSVGGAIGIVCGSYTAIDACTGDFDIPNIVYTPYAIFSGQIPLLKADFIDDKNGEIMYEVCLSDGTSSFIKAKDKNEAEEKANKALQIAINTAEKEGENATGIDSSALGELDENDYPEEWLALRIWEFIECSNIFMNEKGSYSLEQVNKLNERAKNVLNSINSLEYEGKEYKNFNVEQIYSDEMIGYDNMGLLGDDKIKNTQVKVNDVTKYITDLYMYYTALEDIVGEEPKVYLTKGIIDEKYIGPLPSVVKEKGDKTKNLLFDTNKKIEDVKERMTSGDILRDTIAGWYVTLRTIALVGLLSVLVYIGIRILLTASAEDKAKYKKLFTDWFVALCLIFVLHYIMSFAMKITGKLQEIFINNSTETIIADLPETLKVDLNGDGGREELEKGKIYAGRDIVGNMNELTGEDSEKINSRAYLVTNFIGYMRVGVNLYNADAKQAWSCLMIYTILVIFIVVFTYQYLKRVFILAFLTMISPLVALTYPIDKIKDGSAQAFNFWLREYIFNSLIPIIHLLIYTIAISAVKELAISHPVYALVALGSIIPMEKLVRKMFGFEKAGTVGTFATAAGAGMLMNGLKGITRVIGGGRPKPPAKGGGSSKEKMPNIWTHKNDNKAGLDDMLLGGEGIENAAETVSNVASSTAGANSSKGATSKVTSNTSGKGNAAQVNTVGKKPNVVSRASSKIKTKSLGTSNAEGQNTKINNLKSGFKTFKRRSLSGVKAMGSQFYRRNLKGRNPIRTIGKLGATAAGAAVGAGIGLTLGVATGDPSKVATFAGAGATALGGAAGNLYNNGYGAAEDYLDTYSNAYHYDDEEYWNKQRVKEFSSDSNNMTELRNRYSDKEMKYIKENIIPTVVGEEGINDISDICAISDMVMKDGMNLDESVAIAKASNKVGSLSSAKAKKEAMDTISQNYAKKLGISDIRMQVESEIKKLNQPQKPKDIPASESSDEVINKYKFDMEEYEKQKKAYDKQVEEIERPLRERERMVKDLTTQHTNKISSYQKRKK